jgi:hypothetical protein
MSIPIDNYIDVNVEVTSALVGERDFSGLLFTTEAMKETVPESLAKVKTAYSGESAKSVSLTYSEIAALFDEESKTVKFAAKYFGYSAVGSSPRVLNVAKYTIGSEKAAFDSVTKDFTNFGSVTFLGGGSETNDSIATIASAAGNLGVAFIATVNAGDTYPDFSTHANIHTVIGNPEDGVNYAAWMPMAWYASVNYNSPNASGSINYKQFSGETATIDTATGKTAADTANVNYIGQVQVYGSNIAFYQRGINGDGKTELGVFRDTVWLKSYIESAWFNLAGGMKKIPANATGAGFVYSLVTEAASKAVTNGVILVDKPLSVTAKSTITMYTGDAGAADTVQTQGFYITTKLVEIDGKFTCQYLLVYAKADSIFKVEGTHVLV